MTDKSKPSTKKKSFPIRNFARLLDEFIIDHDIVTGNDVTYLLNAVDTALVAHAKR